MRYIWRGAVVAKKKRKPRGRRPLCIYIFPSPVCKPALHTYRQRRAYRRRSFFQMDRSHAHFIITTRVRYSLELFHSFKARPLACASVRSRVRGLNIRYKMKPPSFTGRMRQSDTDSGDGSRITTLSQIGRGKKIKQKKRGGE